MKKIVSLKEVCESDYGVTASATEQPTGTHFLRITDIVNFTDYSGVPFIDIDDEDRRKKLLKQNDIVVARTGATVGASHLFRGTEPTVFASYLVRFRTRTPDVDPVFVSYVLNSPAWKQFIFANAHSKSAQPNLSAAAMMDFQFSLPEIREQQKIASVLRALDDKIAANQLAIHKIQELLHAQWHAITNTEVSSTEPISSIADVNPRTSKPQSDECSFLEMKDLPEYGLIVDRWGKRETKGGTKFRNGDVLLARITPCFENGKMAIVDFLEDDEVGMGSTEYIVFRPKEGIPAAAIHAIISSPEFRSFGYKALTGTSGRQRIAADDLKEIAVPWLSESALTEYRQLADALLKKATALRNENQVLARTRDELLPLLMSGRITVGEAEEAADVAGTTASES